MVWCPMSHELLDPILSSPIFPKLYDQLSHAIKQEEEARSQFLKELTPEMKAEFILGEVCMHSPARARHLQISKKIFLSLGNFESAGGNGCVYAEKCLVSLTRNDFEPDIVWFSDEKAASFTPDQMRFPAPDFIVEVLSESTEARDRGIKFEDYALHGVREYWIVCPESRTVEQYQLDESAQRFALHEKLAHGTVRSIVIEGYELSLSEMFG